MDRILDFCYYTFMRRISLLMSKVREKWYVMKCEKDNYLWVRISDVLMWEGYYIWGGYV